jgi:hypothetical protein
MSLLEAASRLGVTVRVLRRAIRTGRVPAPAHLSATVPLTAEWFASAQAAVAASPKLFTAIFPQKVPPFARYEGTSAWRKYRRRVRAYALSRA